MKILLGRGYFPKELPRAFTTSDFGDFSYEIFEEWKSASLFSVKNNNRIHGKTKSGSYTYKLPDSEAELVSSPKRGFERRDLHITHPIPQTVLTYEIASNWYKIQKWLTRQAFSIDKPEILASAPRGLPDINFEAHQSKKAFIQSTSDWLVRTDITRFYPTIYTHSIAWAAYGKEVVKKSIQLYSGSLADRIDTLVRACNRNQTVGIPVGPETSRIIADIISARIDSSFIASLKQVKSERIDRLQDDWFVGCSTLEEAELVLSHITAAYRGFGLEINGSKTSIDRVSAVSDQQWVSELGSFLAHSKGVPAGRRLREFLTLGTRMQVAHPAQPVTNYLISTIENSKIAASDTEVVESFLLRAIALSPVSIPGVCRVLINLQYDNRAVSIKRVSQRVRQLIKRHASHGNTLEVLWLIYTLRGLSSNIYVSDLEQYVAHPISSAVSLVLLDMESKGLVTGKLNKRKWADAVDYGASITTGNWLLSYEGIRHGWLPDPHGLAEKPFFKPMLDRNVVFYDPKRNVPKTKITVERRRRAKESARWSSLQLIHGLRGFEFGLY